MGTPSWPTYFDRPFAISLVIFGVGSVAGFLLAGLVPFFRGLMMEMFQVRVLGPVESALTLGGFAVVVLIFANNAVPVLLSFLYPILLARVHWTPPLTRSKSELLLTAYSLLTAFLLGFLDLGAASGSILFEQGASTMSYVLRHSWLHGPVEFLLVLLCVAEPARIAARKYSGSGIAPYDHKDAILLFVSLLGLLASAILEFSFGA